MPTRSAEEYRERAQRAREIAAKAKPTLAPALLRLAADYDKQAEDIAGRTEQQVD